MEPTACVEVAGGEVLVYRSDAPGQVVSKQSLKLALQYAREEFPDLGIRLVWSRAIGRLAPSTRLACPAA